MHLDTLTLNTRRGFLRQIRLDSVLWSSTQPLSKLPHLPQRDSMALVIARTINGGLTVAERGWHFFSEDESGRQGSKKTYLCVNSCSPGSASWFWARRLMILGLISPVFIYCLCACCTDLAGSFVCSFAQMKCN